MGETAGRSVAVVWCWRAAVALAALGLGLAIAALAARKWWPDRYLKFLPTPAAVISEAVRIEYTAIHDEDRDRPPVAAILQVRFPRADIAAAFIALLAARAPGEGLAHLAEDWVEQDPASRDGILRAVLAHRSAVDPAERASARAAYLIITHASLFTWLRHRQEADGCWPAAEGPIGPGRWRPGRAAATAFVLLMFMGSHYDHKTPSRAKRMMQNALAGLRGLELPDGRSAEDPRDQAAVAVALCCLHLMTGDQDLLPVAQRALDASRREMGANGDFPWERDTAQAVLQLLACDLGAQAKLDTGHALDDPYRALRRCWALENAGEAGAPRFRWREDGVALPVGGADGLAAAGAGLFFAQACHGGPPPAELAGLRGVLAALPSDPARWSPLGLSLANDAITAGPLVPGTPERRWLEAADQGLDERLTIGDPPWDATWGSSADPLDAVSNAILGGAFSAMESTLGERVFWENQARHPTP